MKARVFRFLLALACGVAGAYGILALGQATPEADAGKPLQVPEGFIDELVTGGLLAPRAMAFAPDGRILLLERGTNSTDDINYASVRVFKNGQLLPTRALSVETCGDSERGLLGIALDPAFASNGYVYLYYTRRGPTPPVCGFNTATNGVDGPRNRVSRFTMTGDTIDPGTERVLLDNVITDIGYHNAGDMAFGADGYLYIAIGEGGIAPLAQSLTTLNGKVLRIRPTESGSPPYYSTAGNPYDTQAGAVYCGTLPLMTVNGATGACRETYAHGLRNPFRFTIRPGTSEAWVADVGGGVWEEINVIAAGANYGYPVREGPCPGGVLCDPSTQPAHPPFADPLYAYPHLAVYANFDSAVIGGAFYSGTTWPAEYHGDFFFADFARGFIQQLSYNGATQSWDAVEPEFATDGVGIVGLKEGLDHNLYYLAYLSDQRTSELRRIRRLGQGENVPPFANAAVSPTGGPLNTVFNFSAADSADPDGNLPLTYTWNFGDGSTVVTNVLTVTHTYTSAGPKSVSLTARDSANPPITSEASTLTVYPGNNPPTATIVLTNTTAPGRANYYMHDTWQYGVANASDDTALPMNAISWEIVFHHQTHHHPFVPYVQDVGGSFEIHVEEPDPVQWYRIILRVRDQQGQETTIYRDIMPVVATGQITTQPAGGFVLIDGITRTTPYTLTRIVDYDVSIQAPALQGIANFPREFDHWTSAQPGGYQFGMPPGGWSDSAVYVTVPPERRFELPMIAR
ncbi:MAG: PQQ-dependent sugar dehydrogenase [Anaerolineales bacterium]|nr:PQQ-dependent sugar dehydrogenase [Anaerolineales bacterium]